MAPDKRSSEAARLLNSTAVTEVQQEQRDTISETPADLEAVEATFESEVLRYASDWLVTNAANAHEAKPFAFVFSRSLEVDIERLKTAGVASCPRYHAFHSQKMLEVTGCVIVATVNLEGALIISVDNVVNSQRLLDAIGEFGLSDRQIAVFEPPPANMMLLRQGIRGRSRPCTVLPTGSTVPWTLAELEAEIAQFHKDETRVPDAALRPWRTPAKAGVTIEKLEVRISQQLAIFLGRPWKRRGSVLAEYPSHAGRIDVFLREHVLEENCGPCIIEVKVLRSRSTTREMAPEVSVKWAMRGLVQADLYRGDVGALSTYLYCFDARDNDEELPQVDAEATRLNIRHRRHFMYRSTEALQDAKAAELAVN